MAKGQSFYPVQCSGFKEQTLGTSKDVIKYLVYLYANPVRALIFSATLYDLL